MNRQQLTRRHGLRAPWRLLVAGLAAGVAFAAAAQSTPAATAVAGGAKSPAAKAAPAARAAMYPTPQAGVDALIGALRAADAKALAAVLGPGHKRIIDSGDSNADRREWARYVGQYDARHSIVMASDAKAILVTGADDWPMPIPLVKGAGGWSFDAIEGENEIVARRVGRNELDAIQVCLAFLDMQREYAEVDRNGDGAVEYTRYFVSAPGTHDGLYWPTKAGEPDSPGGPRLAEAEAQNKGSKGTQPYHGYYYRILTAQGKDAPGGARDYIVNGKLIGGVALVAHPARYLSSGVKTFQCNTDGIVYERDLGPNTAAEAAKITAYNPGPGWTRSPQ